MTVFDEYSHYYDLLYRDKDYSAEVLYLVKYLRRYAPSAHRLLELGCGTGAHAAALVEQGYDVTGIDLSEGMLARAQERRARCAPAIQAKCRFSVGDAREVRIGSQFDAVLALFHVASYQTSNADLLRMFTTAAEHLAPGGLFLFDFWYGPAVLSERPSVRVKDLENDLIRVTRIAEPQLNENENTVEVRYRVLVERKADGHVTRLQESHLMRYLFLPEIDVLLERTGMRRVCATGWLTDEKPSAATWSGFCIAQKSAQ